MERMVSTTGGKSAEVVRERFQYPSDNALVVNTATPGHYRLIAGICRPTSRNPPGAPPHGYRGGGWPWLSRYIL